MTLYQVDYTSRDYDAIRADLIAVLQSRIPEWKADDPSDFTLALLESFAYIGDLMSYYIDRAANEANIQTATQRKTLLNFAEIIGYKPSGPTPAEVQLTFTNRTGSTIDLPICTQASAILTNGPFSQAYFETTEPITQLANNESITVWATEGKTSNTDKTNGIDPIKKTVLPIYLGTSTGQAYMEVLIPEIGVVDDSVFVYVGQQSSFTKWRYVTNLSEFNSIDKVFTTKLNEDGTTVIVFGDGINGYVPPVGEPISGTYRTSVGASGNVKANGITHVSFVPGLGLEPTGISVGNAAIAFGGSDGENLFTLRRNLKGALSTRNRAVTLDDYKVLAELVAGVGRASATSDVYTSVTLYVQPYNDGSDTPGIVSGIETTNWDDLAAEVKSVLGTRIPVGTTLTVLPPTYVELDANIEITVAPSYTQRDVRIAATRSLIDPSIGLFSYNASDFGKTVSISEVISTLMAVPGILEVNIVNLSKYGQTGVSNIAVNKGEIAILLPANLAITATGGIA